MRIHVEAYGCTQNIGEARLMSGVLLRQGHDVLAAENEADAHLLVTCTVIETTQRAMVKRMRVLVDHLVEAYRSEKVFKLLHMPVQAAMTRSSRGCGGTTRSRTSRGSCAGSAARSRT